LVLMKPGIVRTRLSVLGPRDLVEIRVDRVVGRVRTSCIGVPFSSRYVQRRAGSADEGAELSVRTCVRWK